MPKETDLPEKNKREEADMAFGQFSRMSGASEEEQDTIKSSPESTQGTTAEKPIVVVVDDDSEMRYALQKNLEKAYIVHLCSSGEMALSTINAETAVVILDIKMPGMDGFQVYDNLARVYPDLPIIFYSAYQDILEGVALSTKYKPFSYFDKGDDVGKLLLCIERAVAMSANVRKISQIEHRMRDVGKR
jgi:DNA-binding NtrC family response regulator